MPKETEKINIIYSGNGIINGEMDLESFASSVLNFGKAINVIKDYLGINKLDIKIVATKEGSFEVDLVLVADIWGSFKNLLNSDSASALLNLVAILGIGSGGVFKLFKFLKGQEPKNIRQDGDNIYITNIDNTTMVFNEKITEIYQDSKFRECMENFAKSPLDSDSIDNITIKHNNDFIEIDKSEKEFYKKVLWTKESDIKNRIYEQTFSIVSLNFNKGNKWKLSDGRGSINVVIKDESFLNKIENNEVQFAKGDKLICEVELIEDVSGEKIISTYSILKIIDHIKPLKTQRFPIFQE